MIDQVGLYKTILVMIGNDHDRVGRVGRLGRPNHRVLIILGRVRLG